MRVATFNIYWLGGDKIARDDADVERLARVIAKVNADALVFQEIVDPDALREVLDAADDLTARRYTMHDAQLRLLGAGGAQDQKVVAAYDAGRYDLLSSSVINGGVNRLPFALRLRQRSDGARVLVVGVHFQSGFPVFEDAADAKTRRAQAQHLADWVGGAGGAGAFQPPQPGEHVVILGDFNALYESDDPEQAVVVQSLEPLHRLRQGGWWWEMPLADPNGGDRTSSYREHYLIDHVILSPSLNDEDDRIIRRPMIYAFDLDPDFFPEPLADDSEYYRLSDHRPVFVEIDIRP
jgi:endonuclease/exonuclease/phosphatase family metal-dependent hydrolase